MRDNCGWRRPGSLGRPQRGPYTGRGARTAGLVGDRTRNHPLMFPIGRSSATFLVIPARSTVSTTSEMFL